MIETPPSPAFIIDTNVWFSAMLFGSVVPQQSIERARDLGELICSEEIMVEITELFIANGRPNFPTGTSV